MKKKNMFIIGIIVFLLTISVGYALFSETLTITGTATATGDFDVKFVDPGEKFTCKGYTNPDDPKIAVISQDGNTVTITVNKLEYPGAYVDIPIKVQNAGSITVKLDGLNEELFKVDPPLKLSHTEIKNTELISGGVATFNVKVEWDPLDESASQTGTSEFKLKLNYSQK